MKLFKDHKLKMDEKTDDVTPPGGGADETPKVEEKPPEETPSTKDEYGYDKTLEDKVEETPKVEEKPPEEETTPDISGYGKEPEKIEETPKVEEKPPEEEETSKVEGEDGELKVEDKGKLLDTEVADILAFAKEHKLSQDVVNSFVELENKKIAELDKQAEQIEKDRAKAIKERHSKWYDELKADPDFGGDNFDHNTKKVNKVIDEFMPNIKKQLTGTGGLLPPYIMRDFHKLATHLYKTEKLIDGEPVKEIEEETSSKPAHLDFYS